RAVAEEDARAPVLRIGHARERLAPDDEHVVEVAGGQQRRAHDELVDEPGAAGVEVEGPAPHAEAVAHERAGVGDQLLGGRGGDDEEIDGVGGESGVLDRSGAGLDGQGRGRLTRTGDPPLADAGALDDPLVAGVDALLEVGVGEALVGKRRAPSCDGRPHAQATRSHATGWPSRSRSPRCTSMPTSWPRNGLHTGVEVPGPSRCPTVWPSSTWSPASTSSSGRNTPTEGAMIMRSGTRSPSPWVKRASMGYATSRIVGMSSGV